MPLQRVTDAVSIRQSDVWQTNTGVIFDGNRVVLVDPGVLADEIADLTASLDGHEIVAGFATHAHWDHILWDPALGNAPRYASEETVRRVERERDRIERTLDAFEAQLAEQEGLGPQWDRADFYNLLPMPLGPGEIAGIPVELVDVSGHADGQVALVLPEHGVAFVADTLSDVETPSISEGVDRFGRYLATLDRLQPVIDRVQWIVPGHGAVADRAEARRRLDADRRYLERLPGLVAEAAGSGSDEEIARDVAATLGETRAAPGLSWEMHVENVRLLRRREA